MNLVAAPILGAGRVSVNDPYYIIPDNIGVADYLQKNFQRCGIKAQVVKDVLPQMKNVIFLPGINYFEDDPSCLMKSSQ